MKSGFAFIALTIAGLCWGIGFPMGKVAMAEIPAMQMVLLRFAVAAVAALPFALRSRQTRAIFLSPPVILFGDRMGWPLAAGGLLILAGSFVVVLGEKPVPPTPA